MQSLMSYSSKYLLFFISFVFSFLTTAQESQLGWQLTLPGYIHGTPAYFNKTLYATGGNYLYSVSSEGSLNWKVEGVTGDVVVNSTGVIYTNLAGKLAALSPTGEVIWQSEITPNKLLIGRDDEIYTSDDDYIYGIAASGDILWRKKAPKLEPLAVDSNGTLFFASLKNTGTPFEPSLHIILFSYSSEGYEMWRQLIPVDEYTYKAEYSIALSEDVIYFLYNTRQYSYYTGNDSSNLAAINKDGDSKWVRWVENKWEDLGGPTYGGSPHIVIDSKGDLVVKGLFELFKFNSKGGRIWDTDISHKLESHYLEQGIILYEGAQLTSPVITSKDSILASGLNGINWFDSSGNLLVSLDTFDGVSGQKLSRYSSITLSTSGELYFGYNNKIQLINIGEQLSDSAWPTQFQGNNRQARSGFTQALIDTDGDGILDVHDPDNDNDGVPDEIDDAPLDKTVSADNDNDGIDDAVDADDDNDGVEDSLDIAPLDNTVGAINGSGTYRWEIEKNSQSILFINDQDFLVLSSNKRLVSSINTDTRETNWELQFGEVYSLKTSHQKVFVCHWKWQTKEYLLSVFDDSGELAWSIVVENAASCRNIAISETGDIFLGGREYVRALSNQGVDRWQINFPEQYFYTPLISAGEYIYFLSNKGLIVALTTDGREAWSTSIEDSITANGAIDNFGNLILTSTSQVIYLDGATGGIVWSHPVFVDGSVDLKYGKVKGMVVDGNNNLHISVDSSYDRSSFLYSLDKEGNWLATNLMRSNNESGSPIKISAPTVDNNGNIYLYKSNYINVYDPDTYIEYHREDRHLLAFTATAEPLWDYKLSNMIITSYLYNSDSPVLTKDGYIIASGKNGKISAINVGDNKVSHSSWPSAQGNFGNASRANLKGVKTLLRNTTSGKWRTMQLLERQEVSIKEWDFSSNLDWTYQAYDDINGDGYKDVILRHKVSGQWYAYLLSNSQIIDKGYIRITSTWNWQLAGTGDFNKDGKADLLLRHRDGHWILYFMDGRIVENFKRPEMSSANIWVFDGIGDFQPDGHADVLIKQKNTHSRYIYNMESGEFKDRGYLYLGNAETEDWEVIDIVDLWTAQITEKRDIIKRNPIDGRWAIEHLEGRVVQYTKYPALTTGASWRLVNVADFDEDGHADLLMQNEISGRFYQYFLEWGEVKSRGYTKANYSPDWQVPVKYMNPDIYPNIN